MNKFVHKNSETRFQKAETRFQNAETRFLNGETQKFRIFFARTWMDSAQKKPVYLWSKGITLAFTIYFDNNTWQMHGKCYRNFITYRWILDAWWAFERPPPWPCCRSGPPEWPPGFPGRWGRSPGCQKVSQRARLGGLFSRCWPRYNKNHTFHLASHFKDKLLA